MNTKSRSLLAFSLCAGTSLLCVGLAPTQAQAPDKATAALPRPPRHPALPFPWVPGALGVNIHFTDARPGELEMLKEGGFRVIRMDFAWGATEKAKGVYDFSAYDRLIKSLDAHNLQALLILDYSNPLYDEGLAPYTEAGRTAFANWAGAAAAHFKGHRVLWEMYNEPNGGFWKPQADVQAYIKLALATGKAIQRDAPGECYIGPGVSGMDFNFLELCFKAGLLEWWDGVSVHPYRQSDPESVQSEYRRLRLMIERYKPQGKTIPILSGEWGYSSAWTNFNDERQGKYLPRQWMTNLMNRVPVSIWYDWHDDGTDPKEYEHHFGSTENEYFAGRNPVYNPKPSYIAARTFAQQFNGFSFNKRLALDSSGDFLLVFAKSSAIPPLELRYGPPRPDDYIPKLAVWTTGAPHEINIPANPGAFKVVDYLGRPQPGVQATAQGLKLRISDSPLYLESLRPNTILQEIAAWMSAPQEYLVSAPSNVALEQNGPKVAFRRDSPPADIRVSQQFGPYKVTQLTQAVVTNPLSFSVEPTAQNTLQVHLENPASASTVGQLTLNGGGAQSVNLTDPQKSFTFPMPAPAADGSRTINLRFTGKTPDDFVESSNRFVPLQPFAALTAANLATSLVANPDGDPKIESSQTLSLENAPEAAPGGGPVLKLAYRFAPGWKFANIQPRSTQWSTIEGQPKRLGMWVYGDNSGNYLRMRFSDTTGQTFQPSGTPLDWKGWRYYSFPLDNSGGYWGGANDGQVHGTIKVESLFLLDNAQNKGGQGQIYVSNPMWVY